jgi:hypothetical protein
VLPEIVLWRGKRDLHKRAPFGPLWLADQAHVHLSRKPIALLGITGDARAHHVFPSGCPSAVARHHVIEIQVAPIKYLAAVLAGILVAFENVVPGKLNLLFRKPIENQEYDNAWNANLERNRSDYFMVGRARRNIAPAIEIVREEIIRFIGGNHVRVPGVNERKGAARSADIDRLPQAIQHQNLTV